MEVIVAPYEADAQMAFLAKSRSVHAVITEDSDLLTYGCPRVRLSIPLSGNSMRACAGAAHADMLVQHVCKSMLIVTHGSRQPPPQPPQACETLWFARR